MKIQDLERLILKHREAYTNGNPIISDQEFDALEEELKAKNPNSPVLKAVGWLPGSVKHKYPMLSQNKALTNEVLYKWLKSNSNKSIENYFASAKLDGMSCSLRYEKGRFVSAVSRGDGEYGTDISHKVQYIVPKILWQDFTGEVRGEIVMSEENLKSLNTLLPEPYKTTRNGAVGVINSDEVNEEHIKHLNFVAFRLIKEEVLENNPFFEEEDTVEADYEFMRHLGFVIAVGKELIFDSSSTIEDLNKFLEYFYDLRKDYYPLDGVVFRYMNNEEYLSAGDTSHHPVGAIAWKYPSEYQDVRINAIEWSVGTKDITPVALFNPTLIGGATISRVSLKSAKNMVEKGVVVGCIARVHRSGGTIPYLEKVIEYA